MSIHTVLIVAGCVFGFVALMHLLRLIYKVEITIGPVNIPQWLSVLGFIIPASLSVWMFMANAGLL